jgi:hypothetical protein
VRSIGGATLAAGTHAIREVAGNPGIRRIEAAWSLGIAADWAYLVVLLITAYAVGGPLGVGILSAKTSTSPSHSELRSNRASNGLPSMLMLRCTDTVGSRCSIFTKPPRTTGATTGLSADASRFSVHSPLKSGFTM